MSSRFPQKDQVNRALESLWSLLFPDHFPGNRKLEETRVLLVEQMVRALERHHVGGPQKAEMIVDDFFSVLPAVKQKLMMDAEAARDRDPAAESLDEVITCYPGFLALMTYRLAHELSIRGVPLIPRLMSEIAHAATGCDIHPEAKIGNSLFIDHATGVVIGQTSVIGDRVTLFQGVTLGAIALQDKSSEKKRHPTIEDDVVIYSNATILGGQTVIGRGSIIGGSCWITFSVPPDSKVILANPRALLAESRKNVQYVPDWDI